MTTTVKNQTQVYNEFIDFIAAGTTPESLIKFQYSEGNQERIESLIYGSKNGELSSEEQKELDRILVLEHIITLAKAKAHLIIQSQNNQSK